MTTLDADLLKKNRLFILKIVAGLALAFLLAVNDSDAQSKVTSALIKQDTIVALSSPEDTLRYQFGTVRLADQKQTKSGNLAMLFSAILPGSGQLYAHRYYTIPLIWGFGYFFASSAIKANNRYMDYRGKYSESILKDTISHVGDAYILSVREFYHNQRDEYMFYLALTYFLNIIDAYVGATLYNFDVSDDLGGNAQIRFRIPLR